MLAQCVRAEGTVKLFPATVRPVIDFCLDNDINIFQMPCPETECASGGLGRSPHGKKWYEDNGLRSVAKEIGEGQAEYMSRLQKDGNKILAVIGMDFSPACAVNYLNRGPVIYKAEGIYIEELKKAMRKRHIKAPFMGVNQRAHKKLARELKKYLGEEQAQENIIEKPSVHIGPRGLRNLPRESEGLPPNRVVVN